MFIVNAGDDQTTPADRSIRLYQMLRSKNVPAEMHIYSKGGHGFGLGVKGGAVTSWPDLFVNWLKDVK
jgi:dipeptidyl aminopeptidase/acylaminoacyl peptidase